MDIPDCLKKCKPEVYTNKDNIVNMLCDLLMGGKGMKGKELKEKEFVKRGNILFNRFKSEFNACEYFKTMLLINTCDTYNLQRKCIADGLIHIFDEYEKTCSTSEYVTQYNNLNFYKTTEVQVNAQELKKMAKENSMSIEYKISQILYNSHSQ